MANCMIRKHSSVLHLTGCFSRCSAKGALTHDKTHTYFSEFKQHKLVGGY